MHALSMRYIHLAIYRHIGSTLSTLRVAANGRNCSQGSKRTSGLGVKPLESLVSAIRAETAACLLSTSASKVAMSSAEFSFNNFMNMVRATGVSSFIK